MTRKGVKGQGGFSIIEVLISLVIFAIGMLGFAGLEVVAIKNTAFAKELAQANAIAQQTVEQLKTGKYSDVSVGTVSCELENGKFKRTYTVVADSENLIKSLTVTVSWNSASFGKKSVTMVTDIYANPSI